MGIDAIVYYRVPPLPEGIKMPDAPRDPHYGCYNFDDAFLREADVILGDNFEIAHKERIGNYATCAHLLDLLGSDVAREALRFILQSSRGGDTIPTDRVWIQRKAAEQLLSKSAVADLSRYAQQIIRLCEVAERENNPIVILG